MILSIPLVFFVRTLTEMLFDGHGQPSIVGFFATVGVMTYALTPLAICGLFASYIALIVAKVDDPLQMFCACMLAFTYCSS